MAGISRGARFDRGGAAGGGGVTGNLRWGPNYGNNEKTTFGARALIAVNEYRQITQKELLVACAIVQHVDITGLLTLAVAAALSIFFTLVFLYTFTVAAAIALRDVTMNGFLRVAALISFEPTGVYGLLVAASLAIFFTLTFLYTFLVAASIAMTSLVLRGGLQVAAALTGQYSIIAYNLFVASAVRMVNQALAGALQVAAFITVSTVQVGGLLMGTVAARIAVSDIKPIFELLVASAIRMVALSTNGLLQVASALTGAFQITSLNLSVASRISIANEALVLGTFDVAAAVRQTALAEVGLLQVAGLIGPVKLPEAVGLMKVASALTAKCQMVSSNTGSHTWTCPGGVTSIVAAMFGSGGGGGTTGAVNGSGGGGGGGFGRRNAMAVTPGNNYTVTVGAGGGPGAAGGNTTMTGDAQTATGNGGGAGTTGTGIAHGTGGAGGGGTGDNTFTGGTGGGGPTGSSAGAGGGGGAGSAGNGTVGGASTATDSGPGGAGGSPDGGPGGRGLGGTTNAPADGVQPGGGGGGGDVLNTGKLGASGTAVLQFTLTP